MWLYIISGCVILAIFERVVPIASSGITPSYILMETFIMIATFILIVSIIIIIVIVIIIIIIIVISRGLKLSVISVIFRYNNIFIIPLLMMAVELVTLLFIDGALSKLVNGIIREVVYKMDVV